MNKKIIFPIVLGIMVALFGHEAFAANLNKTSMPNVISDIPIGEEIVLFGELMFNVGPNAIEACVTDDAVYIQFNQSFGGVSISLYNSINGLVYSDTVNTDVQQLVIIPIGNEISGTYTLELNSISGSAEGDFEHNNN